MKPSARSLEKARELLSGLTAINQHLGYKFTQPLMNATDAIAIALDAEREEVQREDVQILRTQYANFKGLVSYRIAADVLRVDQKGIPLKSVVQDRGAG